MPPMVGWKIGVHRFATRELRDHRGDLESIRALIAARAETTELPPATVEDVRLAGWRAGLGGIYWLDELVAAGNAAQTMRGGCPESYLIRCEDFRIRLQAGIPNEHWSRNGRGDDGLHAEQEAGSATVDLRALENCDADEWLLVEAWHETDQYASPRDASRGFEP